MYILEFKERVIKDFNKLPSKEKNKIWDKFQLLKQQSRPHGYRKLAVEKTNLEYGSATTE